MQIYMKDGKALKINGGGGYLAPKASGETWVLESICHNFPEGGFIVDFISNNESFNNMNLGSGFASRSLRYDETEVATTNFGFIGYDIIYWQDQAYRTITFLEPPTGDLLTWLQANGTKQ